MGTEEDAGFGYSDGCGCASLTTFHEAACIPTVSDVGFVSSGGRRCASLMNKTVGERESGERE